MGRAAHRLLTAVEGASYGLGSGLLALAERLAVAVSCDARQAAELQLVALVLAQIVGLGHGPSAELARVALAHLGRAEEPDRHRDQQVAICRRLVDALRRAVAAIGRTIEQALVGRSRTPEEV